MADSEEVPEEAIHFVPSGNIFDCVAGEVSKLFVTTEDGVTSFVLLQLEVLHPETDEHMEVQFAFVPEDSWALGDALQAVATLLGHNPKEGTT